MSARLTLAALLSLLAGQAGAQPAVPPDRVTELTQLQFNTRTTRPPPGSMDGAQASAIYKRFIDSSGRTGPAPGGAPSTAGTGQQ